MSKIDKIVKQAELFERLAVFGDRSSFLKKLAQGLEGIDSEIQEAVKAISSAIQSWIQTSGQSNPSIAGGLMKGLPQSVWKYSTALLPYAKKENFDVDDLARLGNIATGLAAVVNFTDMEREGKVAWLQNVNPTVLHLLDLIKQKETLASNIPPVEPEQQVEPHQSNPAQVAKNHSDKQFLTIPKQIQAKLNQLLVPPGDIFPLDEDGVLGPKTQAALEKFKQKFKLPSSIALNDVVKAVQNAVV